MNFLYAIYLYASGAVLTVLAGFAWRRRHVPACREFTPFAVNVTLLMVTYALELTLTDPDLQRRIYNLEWCVDAYVSTFWLLFSLVWCGYGHLVTRKLRIALLVFPTVGGVFTLTNDYHGLVYSALHVDNSRSFPLLLANYGLWTWINFAYMNICIMTANVMFIQQFRNARPLHRRQALIMMLASIIPWVLDIGYSFGVGDGIYITAFGLSITGMLFAWSIFRQHLLDMVPVARHGLVDMMRDPMLVFDEAGRVVDHNRAACRLLCDKDGHESEITREEIARRVPELALALYCVEHGEVDTLHYEGRAFALSLSDLCPTTKKTLTLCLLHDITEQFRAEEKLRQLNASLEERVAHEVALNRAKDQALARQARIAAMGEMISAIAHQWRQPLATLSMTVQDFHAAASQGGPPSQAEWDEFKVDAMEQIRYMSQTIEEFRNFQQPGQKRERFPVVRCLEKSLRLTCAQFKKDNIVREFRSHSGAPLYCFGTPSKLTQVLLNLLVNAKEAIESSRSRNNGYPEQGRVVITLAEINERLQVTVADNGCGVPDELRDRLFEPYITSKENSGSSGLGLYLAKMLVETGFGGTLSHLNFKEGACFVIDLPVIAEGEL